MCLQKAGSGQRSRAGSRARLCSRWSRRNRLPLSWLPEGLCCPVGLWQAALGFWPCCGCVASSGPAHSTREGRARPPGCPDSSQTWISDEQAPRAPGGLVWPPPPLAGDCGCPGHPASSPLCGEKPLPAKTPAPGWLRCPGGVVSFLLQQLQQRLGTHFCKSLP